MTQLLRPRSNSLHAGRGVTGQGGASAALSTNRATAGVVPARLSVHEGRYDQPTRVHSSVPRSPHHPLRLQSWAVPGYVQALALSPSRQAHYASPLTT